MRKGTLLSNVPMHALLSRCAELHINSPHLMLQLFDTMVKPVFLYGCEVWDVDFGMQVHEHVEELSKTIEGRKRRPDSQELLHKKFIRRVLGVCESTPDVVVLGEVGRLPLAFARLKHTIKYYNRLCKLPDHRLLKKAFLDNTRLADTSQSWVALFRSQIMKLGVHWENLQPLDDGMITDLEQRYIEAWKLKLSTQSIKTQSYLRITEPDFNMQTYLKKEKSKLRRQIFARFRTGSHWLQVQVGRFQNMERKDRICCHCTADEIEDEEHFLFRCEYNENIRSQHKDLFEGQASASLENWFQQDNARIARFIEKCYEAQCVSPM